MSMEERNNRVVMEQYGFPVVNHSTLPSAPPSAPSATAISINGHSTPVAPQAVSVVNNVVVSPGVQYHPPVTGYAVVETKPPSLPCCGIGVGWFLFIFGWFVAMPWYAGAIILLCAKVDPRERPGYIGCTIMAIITTIFIIIISVEG